MIGISAAMNLHFHTENNELAIGYRLYAYQTGTTTEALTWKNKDGTSYHTFPIILDTNGEIPSDGLYLSSGVVYDFVLKTTTDELVRTYPEIQYECDGSSGGGYVDGIDAGDNIAVDSTDPTRPIVSVIDVVTQDALDTHIADVSDGAHSENNLTDTLKATYDAHGTRITTNETDIDALKTTTTDHGARITTDEADIDALKVITVDHETRITVNEVDIDALETVAEGHDDDIENIYAELASLVSSTGSFVYGALVLTLVEQLLSIIITNQMSNTDVAELDETNNLLIVKVISSYFNIIVFDFLKSNAQDSTVTYTIYDNADNSVLETYEFLVAGNGEQHYTVNIVVPNRPIGSYYSTMKTDTTNISLVGTTTGTIQVTGVQSTGLYLPTTTTVNNVPVIDGNFDVDTLSATDRSKVDNLPSDTNGELALKTDTTDFNAHVADISDGAHSENNYTDSEKSTVAGNYNRSVTNQDDITELETSKEDAGKNPHYNDSDALSIDWSGTDAEIEITLETLFGANCLTTKINEVLIFSVDSNTSTDNPKNVNTTYTCRATNYSPTAWKIETIDDGAYANRVIVSDSSENRSWTNFAPSDSVATLNTKKTENAVGGSFGDWWEIFDSGNDLGTTGANITLGLVSASSLTKYSVNFDIFNRVSTTTINVEKNSENYASNRLGYIYDSTNDRLKLYIYSVSSIMQLSATINNIDATAITLAMFYDVAVDSSSTPTIVSYNDSIPKSAPSIYTDATGLMKAGVAKMDADATGLLYTTAVAVASNLSVSENSLYAEFYRDGTVKFKGSLILSDTYPTSTSYITFIVPSGIVSSLNTSLLFPANVTMSTTAGRNTGYGYFYMFSATALRYTFTNSSEFSSADYWRMGFNAIQINFGDSAFDESVL